jgi:subtilisin family serine protease
LGAALCASAAEHAEFRFTPAKNSRVLVELHPSARQDVLARLRADLTPSRLAADSASAPRIAYEYRVTLFGAAVEADAAAVARIRALPYVRAVHEDRVFSVNPVKAPIATADAVDARTKVNASTLGTGGDGITVAVIDTGVDYTHPALGGGFGAGHKVAGGWDFVNNDADPMDDNGHGTHVAGTVAASAPDLIGVAPDATIFAYKVLSAGGSGSNLDIIAAIERTVDPNGDGDPSDHLDVANLSLGGPGDAEDAVSRAVDAAAAAGVVMVVAAGNDGATASIGSPGTAVDALTVAAIDDGGRVTDFSSRGPAPRLLGFKPDVAAPGFQIISAKVGGGTIALNGTSMATPHVAGVAALLRKLHPEWTPAEVKAAITSSATAIDAAPFARGAGRADARAAHESKLFLGSSGLSFGIRPARTGDTRETKSIRLTNRTAAIQSLSLAAGTVPAGVTLRITPNTLQLQPGASADVAVELQTANATFEFPNDWLVGGDIRVTGGATASIPWALLRAARARVTYDGLAATVLALGPGGAQGQIVRDPQSVEVLLSPGKRWDFLLYGFDHEGGERRFIVKPGVEIDGDHVVEIRKSDASIEVTLDARDEHGASLSARSAADPRILHLIGSRLFWRSGNDSFRTLIADHRHDTRRLFYSPLSDDYQLYHFEQFVDFEAGRTYTVEHDAVRGLSAPLTLASGGSDLMAATVRWRGTPSTVRTCVYDALTDTISTSFASCYAAPAPAANSFIHHVNAERFPLAHNGMIFTAGEVMTQALRGRGEHVVASSDFTPALTALQLEPGGGFTIGAAPGYPFALPGTRTAAWFRQPFPGVYSAAGDALAARVEWTTFDRDGTRTGTGSWGGAGGAEPLAPRQLSSLLARHDKGTLEVTFGISILDLNAPTLTSMSVVDAEGRLTDRLTRGDAASLRFSVADFDYTQAATALPGRPEATKAWVRVSGTETWQPLTVNVTGTESGSLNSLGHIPAGDLYSASLASATAVDGKWLDLRVEFADPAGNKVRWTQEAAVSVGEPSVPPRRRVVRK